MFTWHEGVQREAEHRNQGAHLAILVLHSSRNDQTALESMALSILLLSMALSLGTNGNGVCV